MFKDFFIKNNSLIYLFGFIFLFQAWMVWNVPTLSDELPHFVQIREFAVNENPRILPLITTPTYFHRSVSTGLEISNILNLATPFLKTQLMPTKELFDLFVVRVTLLVLIFITLLYSSYLLHIKEETNANIALLTIITIPIIFPFIPLVYTDVLAVSLILLSYIAGLRGKTKTSSIAILLATLCRQPSISWIVPLIVLIYTKEKKIISIVPHISILLGFGLFTIINKGIAVGDKTSHTVGLHLSNLWFFGFIFFVTTIGYFYKTIVVYIKLYIQKNKSIVTHILALLSLLSLFVIFNHTYEITHKYNTSRYGWFLRNRLLSLTTTITWANIIFGIISISGIFMFLSTVYSKRYIYSEYIFKFIALASISAMPLVEQRYYIPIFVLVGFYIATSDQQFKIGKAALTQSICNIAIGLYFFISIVHIKFFL